MIWPRLGRWQIKCPTDPWVLPAHKVNDLPSPIPTLESSLRCAGGGGLKEEERWGARKEEPPASSASWEFHTTGPRNLSSPGWRDLISSSWRDPNYRRIAMSCFVQAAYLLELDRQETTTSALAPSWWKPFKYKLLRPLIDSRDGSIYGALLEWDQLAALSDLIVLKPQGAPKAVLAIRGTLLRPQTLARDLEDDLRLFARDSLRGSVRFAGALEVLKSAIHKHGSSNVCVAGHSLAAAFAHRFAENRQLPR